MTVTGGWRRDRNEPAVAFVQEQHDVFACRRERSAGRPGHFPGAKPALTPKRLVNGAPRDEHLCVSQFAGVLVVEKALGDANSVRSKHTSGGEVFDS